MASDYTAKTILIVDDNIPLVKGLSEYLVDFGYSPPLTATDGVEAFNILSNNHVDVVLLDLNLPGLNGWEVLAKCRESKIDSKFIILSVDDSAEYGYKAAKYGATDYIPKASLYDVCDLKIRSAIEFGNSILSSASIDLLTDKLSQLRELLVSDTSNENTVSRLDQLIADIESSRIITASQKRELTFVQSALANATGNVMALTLIQVAIAIASLI